MKAGRAATAKKPRVVKSWRVRKDVVKMINKVADKLNISESEVVEEGVETIFALTFPEKEK